MVSYSSLEVTKSFWGQGYKQWDNEKNGFRSMGKMSFNLKKKAWVMIWSTVEQGGSHMIQSRVELVFFFFFFPLLVSNLNLN